MNKERVDNIVSTFGYWCITIGLPLCVVGVGIVVFSGLFGKDQFIGFLVAISGVVITLLALLCIAIKLMVGDVFGRNHDE